MNEDELLDQLAQRERLELERRAPEWEEVVHGRLSPNEAAERIRARGHVDEEELQRAIELFTPLSASFTDALVERLATRERPDATVIDEPASDDRPDATVIEQRDRSWWRRVGPAAALGVAAAAALVFLIVRPGAQDRAGVDAALPSFGLTVEPGAATIRAGADGEVPTIAAGGTATLVLRPATTHAHAVQAWVCLERDGTSTPIEARVQPVGKSGALQVEAAIPSDVAPGPATIVTVVAANEPAPDPCALKDAPAHRVQRAPVEIAGAP